MDGRDYVIPDDVKAVAPSVLAHRIITRTNTTQSLAQNNETVIDFILDTVKAPIE